MNLPATTRRLLPAASAQTLPFLAPSRRDHAFHTEAHGHGVSYGLHLALAGKGVIAKDKVFHNLDPFELQCKGAQTIEPLSGFPIYVRGNAASWGSEISKAMFSKLLKQVTLDISSKPTIFVHDCAVGSSSKCDAKVRIISDSPSAVSFLYNAFWKTSGRAISHDPCPLTVYIAASISPSIGGIIGPKAQESAGFLAVDIERSSLILCGKSFADARGTKDALVALSARVIAARRGLPLHARILLFGDSTILVFAPDVTIQSCSALHEILVSEDAGVVLSSCGIAPFFRTRDSTFPNLLQKPASVVFAAVDSTHALPSISRLSPYQAAYHFLAGYQDGKFLPTYSQGPSPIHQVDLAKALLYYLEENKVPSFLVNVNNGGKHIEGRELVKIVESTLRSSVLEGSLASSTDPKVADLKGKYKSFLSSKFQNFPQNFSF